jgi:hypothetical protein
MEACTAGGVPPDGVLDRPAVMMHKHQLRLTSLQAEHLLYTMSASVGACKTDKCLSGKEVRVAAALVMLARTSRSQVVAQFMH